MSRRAWTVGFASAGTGSAATRRVRIACPPPQRLAFDGAQCVLVLWLGTRRLRRSRQLAQRGLEELDRRGKGHRLTAARWRRSGSFSSSATDFTPRSAASSIPNSTDGHAGVAAFASVANFELRMVWNDRVRHSLNLSERHRPSEVSRAPRAPSSPRPRSASRRPDIGPVSPGPRAARRPGPFRPSASTHRPARAPGRRPGRRPRARHRADPAAAQPDALPEGDGFTSGTS